MMSLLLLPVLIAYSLSKIDIFLVAIADSSKSFNEAVDKLFQSSWVVNLWKVLSMLLQYVSIAYFAKEKQNSLL